MKLDAKRWYGLPDWNDLPSFMRTEEVRPYYDKLRKRKASLYLKRGFDFSVAAVMLTVLSLPMAVIAVGIKLDTPGPVFYKPERVTTYGKKFKIHKFRTMVENAEKMGTSVTVNNDKRITRMGQRLRDLRLDELPQIIDVLEGNMSFVGTRPEAVKYVKQYKPEMFATLLMPAGITSEACIRYKDEHKMLKDASYADEVYVNEVMPAKMKWNLNSVERFSFLREISTMFRTVFAVLGKDYE